MLVYSGKQTVFHYQSLELHQLTGTGTRKTHQYIVMKISDVGKAFLSVQVSDYKSPQTSSHNRATANCGF